MPVPTCLPLDAAGLVFAADLVSHQILGDDDIAFGADHFGDLGDAARAVAHALGLDDHVDRAHDHFADGLASAAGSRPW